MPWLSAITRAGKICRQTGFELLHKYVDPSTSLRMTKHDACAIHIHAATGTERQGRSVRLRFARGHADRIRGRIARDRAGTRRKHSAALEIALLDFWHRTCRSYLSTWETNPLRVHFSALGPRLLPDCLRDRARV